MSSPTEELLSLLQEELGLLRRLFSHITYQQIGGQSVYDLSLEAEKIKLEEARKEILKKQRKIYAKFKKDPTLDPLGEKKWLLDQILEMRQKIRHALIHKSAPPQKSRKLSSKKLLMVDETADG